MFEQINNTNIKQIIELARFKMLKYVNGIKNFVTNECFPLTNVGFLMTKTKKRLEVICKSKQNILKKLQFIRFYLAILPLQVNS